MSDKDNAAQKAQRKADERMRHDYPILQQFHTKHALGALSAPSCLCCGHQTHPITRPIAVQHMELPAIVLCRPCKAAAAALASPASPAQPMTPEHAQQAFGYVVGEGVMVDSPGQPTEDSVCPYVTSGPHRICNKCGRRHDGGPNPHVPFGAKGKTE
jgi:hypothetical protein